MRNLFSVLSKILGLFFLCSAISNFLLILTTFSIYISSSFDDNFTFSIFSYSGLMIGQLLSFYILTIKTDKISEILRITNEEIDQLNVFSILQPGIILLGIYLFTTNISNFINHLYIFLNQITGSKDILLTNMSGVITFFSQLIKIGIAASLIFNSEKISSILNKDKN